MPTGYTAPIHDNEPITFEQFALRCSRAMGAAIMQRDQSIDVEIELRQMDDHEQNAVDKARAELDEALARDYTAWEQIQATEIAAQKKHRDEYVAERDAMALRYAAMRRSVVAWEPPTEEHFGLKKFMLDQIDESVRFDIGSPSQKPWEPPVENELPVAEFKAKRLARLAENLARASQRLAEEQERVRSQNEWVIALRDSLK